MLKPLPENSERVLPYHVIWINTGPRINTPLLDRAFLDQEFSDTDDLSLQFVASSSAAQTLIWVWIYCGWQWSAATFWSCICICIRVTDSIYRSAIQSFCKFCYLLWTTMCSWRQFGIVNGFCILEKKHTFEYLVACDHKVNVHIF